jgi:hypothetical protein
MNDRTIIAKIKKIKPRDNADKKKIFSNLLTEYYKNRLRLCIDSEVVAALNSKKTTLIEASHGAQLGHIGIHRLYLKGAEIAKKAKNAVMLFLVGDQYQPSMYPEINRVYFPRRGKRGAPFLLPIKKEDKRRPLYEIPPPSEKNILRLKNQMLGLFGPNFHDFCERYGIEKNHVNKSFFMKNLEHITEVLIESSKKTKNYADWVIRCQIALLSEVFPELFGRYLIFFPISMLQHLPEFSSILEDIEEINRYKIRVSEFQRLRGDKPYLSRNIPLNLSPFWYHCPQCHSRNRGTLADGEVSYTCTTCGEEVVQKIEEGFSNPDIVFSQILTPASIGTAARIVGHIHPYAEVADEYLSKMLKIPPPERLLLSTYPVFHGLGDADGGDSRCSLIRALLEAERDSLRKLAYDDWNSYPHIYSYYYRYVNTQSGDKA